jgi:MinD-like ATPase involved in chromosome partitioning or flagellar assembly
MGSDRYVVLGLAHARSVWFRDVARWATSGSIPADFVKCVSVEEVVARLRSNRPFSALLVDGSLAAVDRDLCDTAAQAGCAVLVVEDDRVQRDWRALGASASLRPGLDHDDLMSALAAHAALIARGDAVPGPDPDAPRGGWRGRLIAVTGAGGSGASTVAIALAQALGDDVRNAGLVVLADLALDGDQAMLHDARDVVPGVQELVEAHRSGRPTHQDIRALTWSVTARRYHLLLGLRRRRDWTTIRPRSFEAALDGLRRSYRMVVCDIDADVDGERECGSVDVEERNVMARTVAATADVVLVVGTSSMKGIHSTVRVIDGLIDHGVEPTRLLTVLNRAPRNPAARARATEALGDLVAAPVPSPVFLPDRRKVDDALRDGARLPAALASPIVGAVGAVLDRLGDADAPAADVEPVPIVPGSLGAWAG